MFGFNVEFYAGGECYLRKTYRTKREMIRACKEYNRYWDFEGSDCRAILSY